MACTSTNLFKLLTTHDHFPVSFYDGENWQSNKNGGLITFGNPTDCLGRVFGSLPVTALQTSLEQFMKVLFQILIYQSTLCNPFNRFSALKKHTFL
jgi:hypothetical protein